MVTSTFAGRMEAEHRQAGSPLGEAIAQSGLVRLQTLIWAVKTWIVKDTALTTSVVELATSLQLRT
jgi:hypothetical protein